MSSTQILVIVLIALVVIILAGVAWFLMRRQSLQRRFGPEYDRAVAEGDSRLSAERDLRERERRHSELELTELSPEARERYAAQWEEIQVRFVDAPENAVGAADDLVTQLVADRGYPTDDYDEQLDHLSVEHARTLGNYREAHEISLRNRKGEATTEELRRAVLHYRSLVADLLGGEPAVPAADTAEEPARDSMPDATREADRGTTDDSTHDSTQR